MAVFAPDPKGHADQHLLLCLFFATCQRNAFSLSTPLTLVWFSAWPGPWKDHLSSGSRKLLEESATSSSYTSTSSVQIRSTSAIVLRRGVAVMTVLLAATPRAAAPCCSGV